MAAYIIGMQKIASLASSKKELSRDLLSSSRMTGYPAVLPQNDFQRRWPEVGFKDSSARLWPTSGWPTIDELAFVTTGYFSVRNGPPSDHVLTTLVPRRSNRMTKTLDEIGATRCQEHPCIAAATGGRYGVNRRLRTILDDTLLRNPER